MIRLKVREIIDLFDVRQDDLRHDISSIINLVGEDLGAELFKRYYEKTFRKDVRISSSPPLGVTIKKKGPRLDRWIYIKESKSKFVAYQTEIKNWSANAIGARPVGIDPKQYPKIALLNWKERLLRLTQKEKNGESKVLSIMKPPKDLPNGAKVEPLIIYWFMLSKNGRNLNPYFNVSVNRNGFKKLNVFSMSNYLRSIKDKELHLKMPSAEKRILLLKKYFRIK